MAERRFQVDAGHAGERIDKVVTALVPGLGRSGARKLFERGEVRVNGKRVRKGDLAAAGDEVTVTLPDVQRDGALPEPDAPLDVVLETREVVVVDKPRGQPTATLEPGETGTLANALVGRYPEMAGVGYSTREPGLVHRLDTDTSGLVVAARTPAAFEALSAALKEGRIEKAYLLVCEAAGLAESGTIEIPLAPHPKDTRRVYACAHPRDVVRYSPRPAITRYKVLRAAGRWALVEASAPKAIRHQIRAHMAELGHPLAGDDLYGGPAVPGLQGHTLHASYVKWTGDAIVPAFEVRSALPAPIERLLEGG